MAYRARLVDRMPEFGLLYEDTAAVDTGTDLLPIFSMPPQDLACNGYLIQPDGRYMGRLVDYHRVNEAGSGVAGYSGEVLPVFAAQPGDCCQGDPRVVPQSRLLFPSDGAPRQLICTMKLLYFSGDRGATPAQHDPRLQCKPFYLDYSGIPGTGTSVPITGTHQPAGGYQWSGESHDGLWQVVVWLQGLAFGGSVWGIWINGCGLPSSHMAFNVETCHAPIMVFFDFHTGPANCYCHSAGDEGQSYDVQFNILGPCPPRYLARLIDYAPVPAFLETGSGSALPVVVGPGPLVPIFAFARSCQADDTDTPPCCLRLPCKLIATLMGGCLDGVIVNLNYINVPAGAGAQGCDDGPSAAWSGFVANVCGLPTVYGVRVVVCCYPSGWEHSSGDNVNYPQGHCDGMSKLAFVGSGSDSEILTGTGTSPRNCKPDGYYGCDFRNFIAGSLRVTVYLGDSDSFAVIPHPCTYIGWHCDDCACTNPDNLMEVVDFSVDCPYALLDTAHHPVVDPCRTNSPVVSSPPGTVTVHITQSGHLP